jgi:hypothetical protein
LTELSDVLLCFVVFTAQHCTGSAELQFNNPILPGESGLFRCSVTGADLFWMINDELLNFRGSNNRGTLQGSSLSHAVLLVKNEINSTTSNRTSVLLYVPEPNVTGMLKITCGGRHCGRCTANVSFGKCLR